MTPLKGCFDVSNFFVNQTTLDLLKDTFSQNIFCFRKHLVFIFFNTARTDNSLFTLMPNTFNAAWACSFVHYKLCFLECKGHFRPSYAVNLLRSMFLWCCDWWMDAVLLQDSSLWHSSAQYVHTCSTGLSSITGAEWTPSTAHWSHSTGDTYMLIHSLQTRLLLFKRCNLYILFVIWEACAEVLRNMLNCYIVSINKKKLHLGP